MKKPVILVIMDGYGIRKETYGNAIAKAKKPNLDRFFARYPYTLIEASGLKVGLPEGQMGNSEVGHLNIGAGRIVYQSLTLIDQAIVDGSFFKNQVYLNAFEYAKTHHKKVHLIGLVSDGGVHSHIRHWQAMIQLASQQKIDKLFVHALMDGRDVAPQLGASYIQTLIETMTHYHCGQLASIGGRYYAMDRDKNMLRVGKAYDAMVLHQGPSFTDYQTYFKQQYAQLPQEGKDPSDEFLIPHFAANVPGQIDDGDAVIFMNFRPDRAIQFCTLLTNPNFYSQPPLIQGKAAWVSYTPSSIRQGIHLVQTMKYADSVKGPIAFQLPTLDNT
jgi:2,3-bisphosphoglycerate-independent phosphoglycerate mutase